VLDSSHFKGIQMTSTKYLDQANGLVDQAAHSAQHAVKSTKRVANEAVDGVVDASLQLREKALQVSHNTVNYVRDEPVKSLLIAAATGAALMAMFSFMSHSRERR
jgi:ElaB/YqjD/DUF883 family membrane-anchored ribosome-binding protein